MITINIRIPEGVIEGPKEIAPKKLKRRGYQDSEESILAEDQADELTAAYVANDDRNRADAEDWIAVEWDLE